MLFDEYSPIQLEVIEMCDAFLDKHEHFRFHIAHSDLDDYNILWGNQEILEWIECCLKRDYSRYEGQWQHRYLVDCMNTLKADYGLTEEAINEELEILKTTVLEILAVVGSEEK